MVFTASLLGAQHKKGIVWRTSRQACLLRPWARHLTGRLTFMWQTGGLSVLHRVTIVKLLTQHLRRLLGTHQWQSALSMVGLPVTQDWFEMGCHLSPPSRGRGGVTTNKQTSGSAKFIVFGLPAIWIPSRIKNNNNFKPVDGMNLNCRSCRTFVGL